MPTWKGIGAPLRDVPGHYRSLRMRSTRCYVCSTPSMYSTSQLRWTSPAST